MLLRIEVNIVDKPCEIALGINLDATKGFFKQAAGSLIRNIYRLCITVEKIGKLSRHLETCQVFGNLAGLAFLDANQQMKVISHQAISKRIAHRQNIFLIQTEKVQIIPLLKKNIFPVVATIEDVKVFPRFQGNAV